MASQSLERGSSGADHIADQLKTPIIDRVLLLEAFQYSRRKLTYYTKFL